MVDISGDNAFEQAMAAIGKQFASKASMKVGFLEGATYPDGTPVALVAAVQNYGAPSRGIPPRPFMDNTVAAHQAEWAPALAALIQGGMTPEQALDALGEGVEGQIKQEIVNTVSPPLKPATVKRKGFAKPLVDTGHMLASTGHEVTP